MLRRAPRGRSPTQPKKKAKACMAGMKRGRAAKAKAAALNSRGRQRERVPRPRKVKTASDKPKNQTENSKSEVSKEPNIKAGGTPPPLVLKSGPHAEKSCKILVPCREPPTPMDDESALHKEKKQNPSRDDNKDPDEQPRTMECDVAQKV